MSDKHIKRHRTYILGDQYKVKVALYLHLKDDDFHGVLRFMTSLLIPHATACCVLMSDGLFNPPVDLISGIFTFTKLLLVCSGLTCSKSSREAPEAVFALS